MQYSAEMKLQTIISKTGHTRDFIRKHKVQALDLIRDNPEVVNLSQSILNSISVLTASSLCIDFEKEIFITIGCYMYRTSPAIMELQNAETTQTDSTVEMLQSISRKIDFAKDLITKCKENATPISDGEVKVIVSQLEEVIRDVGGELSLIPPTTFQDQKFAAIAVRSLSQEMKNIQFNTSGSQLHHSSENESLQDQRGRVHELLEGMQSSTTEVSKTETDLYSIDIQVSMENLQVNYGQKSVDSTNSSGIRAMKPMVMTRSYNKFVEPMYGAFFCPLTKNVMVDPVTVGSGVTYEREAIAEWLTKFEDPEEMVCPTTGQKLFGKDLSTNIALKKTIEEWRERNEVGMIKAAASALSSASSANMVLEALKDLQSVCKGKEYNKVQVYSMGMLPLIGKFLGFKDRNVRCCVLDLLRDLADNGDDGKEIVANAVDIYVVIKMLSSSHHPTRHASLLFLLELSKSQYLSKRIGSIKGSILILVTNKFNLIDSVAAEKASEILKNLESHPKNIKHMAENGYVEPLLNHLNEGNEEIKQEMATYLGGIFLDIESQIFVAERAAPSLIDMVCSDNDLSKRAAFKALAKISLHHPNSKILVQSGIMQIMVEEIFSHNETINSKAEAASILANVIESGLDMESVKVTGQGHMMNSDYIIYSIVHMITHSTPIEININLIKILMNMTRCKKSISKVVSIFKESEASYTLIDLINSQDETLAVAAIKLLTSLCSSMGHTLAERLCKTNGLPENLIRIPSARNLITERMVVSTKFLATIPHQNLALNVAILNKELVPEVLQKINQVQGSAARFSNTYLEGLVGVLVRFTTTLYDPQILLLARTNNFTAVLTELLMKTSSDEVQRLSAQGLENLSAQTANLSKHAEIKNPKLNKLISLPKSWSFRSSRKINSPLLACPVHRGACSSQTTFCLVDAKAVERLLGCLDHENAAVVEAAMSALGTLLDDKVDVRRSLRMLSEANAVQHVLKVVKEHRAERLWQKSFWMIEKFLMRSGDRSVVSEIRQDRVLSSALVSAFHRGDGTMKPMAERILRQLAMGDPSSSSTYTTITTYTTF